MSSAGVAFDRASFAGCRFDPFGQRRKCLLDDDFGAVALLSFLGAPVEWTLRHLPLPGVLGAESQAQNFRHAALH